MRRSIAKPPVLKHLAFFETLGRLPEDSPAALATTAGLLALRLVDNWILAGPVMVQPESVSVRSVRHAIMAVDAHEPLREVLLGLTNTMQTPREVDVAPLLPRIFAYAGLLERRGEFALAADVYETSVRLGSEEFDGDLILDAHMRLGLCMRGLSRFVEAEAAFGEAGRLAKKRGDPARGLRSRIGLANVVFYRGDIPLAERMLEEITAACQAGGFAAERAQAVHTSATVARKRGQLQRAVSLAYDALQFTPSPADRERILGDLGAIFIDMKRFDAARDALLVLEATAMTATMRWSARVNLLALAARAGDGDLFVRSRGQLASVELPPNIHVNFLIESARGFRRFGKSEHARELLEAARSFAEANSLNSSIFEVEQMLEERESPACKSVAESETCQADPAAHVESGLRLMAAALEG